MLYLASQSPQRSLLLAKANIPFKVIETSADEEQINLPHPQAMALERARAKADGAVVDALLTNWQDDDAILSADTVVSLGNETFGKPKDADDAIRILSTLSGTTHIVTTAHCVMVPARGDQQAMHAVGVSFAKITLRMMTEDEIRAYVATGESAARSGAYAIQESADQFVVDREGDYDTVVGLHVKTVHNLYRECTGKELPGAEELPDLDGMLKGGDAS